jgi:CRP/FNR family transcriptional regulator, cyclic AMP receptor protein
MSDDSIARSVVPSCEAKTIATRFSSTEGSRLLRDLLLRQPLVEGKDDIAHELALVSMICPFETNDAIIVQGAADTDIFLILVGSVIVSPNGREDTIRSAGTHVGEMAAIDPAALRSATVRAREPSVLVRITEPDFSRVASAHPHIWRYLAREMADRLRQRVAKVPARKPISRVFIGSSSEGLSPAKVLQGVLPTDFLEVKLWTDDIFAASLTNIEALEAELRSRAMFLQACHRASGGSHRSGRGNGRPSRHCSISYPLLSPRKCQRPVGLSQIFHSPHARIALTGGHMA